MPDPNPAARLQAALAALASGREQAREAKTIEVVADVLVGMAPSSMTDAAITTRRLQAMGQLGQLGQLIEEIRSLSARLDFYPDETDKLIRIEQLLTRGNLNVVAKEGLAFDDAALQQVQSLARAFTRALGQGGLADYTTVMADISQRLGDIASDVSSSSLPEPFRTDLLAAIRRVVHVVESFTLLGPQRATVEAVALGVFLAADERTDSGEALGVAEGERATVRESHPCSS